MCLGKKRFKDRAQAKRSVGNIKRNTTDQMRYYRCPHCKGWHLSSKNYGDYDGKKRREVKKK